MAEIEIISVQYGKREFAEIERGFQHIADRLRSVMGSNMTATTRRILRETFERIHAGLEQTHGRPWSWGAMRNKGRRHLYRRTGDGLAALLRDFRVDGSFKDNVYGRVAVRGYMAVQETGEQINARNGWMTIPLPAAMDSRGVPLKPRARDWPNTFVRRSRRGNLLIFQRQGRQVVPLYLLRRQVYVPPRLRMMEHMSKEVGYFEDKMIDELEAHLEVLL